MTLIAASASAQDVVMRRPLPNQAAGSTQDGVTPTPTPGNPDDPFTVTPTPTPPPSEPPPGSYYYFWSIGQWTGDAQCGTQSTLTRTVTCMAEATQDEDVPGDDGPGDPPPLEVLGALSGDGRIMNASYMKMDGGIMSPAIFDPAGSQAKLMLASVKQGDLFEVPFQHCLDSDGPMPTNTYTGTGGGCEYEPVTSTPAEVDAGNAPNPANVDISWQSPDPDNPAAATCSEWAYRNLPYTCVRTSDNAQVDVKLCFENPKTGGQRNYDLPGYQMGNLSGCKAEWKSSLDDLGCHVANDPYGSQKGPVLYGNRDVWCERSDGTRLEGADEAACDVDPDRPFKGVTTLGSCVKSWDGGSRGRCLADGAGVISRTTVMRGNRDVENPGQQALMDQCMQSGGTCFASRSPAANYAPELYASAIQLICTDGKPVLQGGGPAFYPDECAFAADPSQGCPQFYNNSSAGITWVRPN